jgi:hypothetical protein
MIRPMLQIPGGELTMRTYFVAAALVLLLPVCAPAFIHSGIAAVARSVEGSTGALITGVTVKAIAVDSGVVTTTLSYKT